MGLYLGKTKVSNVAIGEAALGITDISDETTINLSGLVKGENGTVKVAKAGTDYLTPDALNDLGDLANKDKVSLSDLNTDVSQKLDSGLTINDINTALNNSSIHTNATYEPQNDRALADKHYVDKKSLPNATSSDNGKVLGVSNGAWTITEPSAKICVGSYTGDNTASRTIALEFAPKIMFISIEITDPLGQKLTQQFMLMNDGKEIGIGSSGKSSGLSNISSTKISLSDTNLLYTSKEKTLRPGNETNKVYNYVLLA